MTYYPLDIEKAVRTKCERRRLSVNTANTYVCCIKKFLKWADKPVNRLSKRDVSLFLEHLSSRKRAGNTMNVYHMALKFLFEEVFWKRMWINIRYSKVPKKLPVYLTRKEARLLFEHVHPRHQLFFRLAYGAGLRLSETLNLNAGLLYLDRLYGVVRQGKGAKDRLFVVPRCLRDELRKRIYDLDPDDHVFRNPKGKRYSRSTFQKLLKPAAKKAGIDKNVGCHVLRHSFGTHLAEDGYSITDIQAALGHSSPETSRIYIHTATDRIIRLRSPLDDI